MSARRTSIPQPAHTRVEPALALPALFSKTTSSPILLDSQAVALAEMNHELLFAIDANRGTVLDANPSFLRRVSLERDQVTGRRLADLLHLADISQYLMDLPAGRPVRFTQRMTFASAEGAAAKERPSAWEFRVVRLPPPADACALVNARPLEDRRAVSTNPWTQHLQSLPSAARRAAEQIDRLPLFDWLLALPTVLFAAQFQIAEDGKTYRLAYPPSAVHSVPLTLSSQILSHGAPRGVLSSDPSFEWIERSHAAAVVFFPLGDAGKQEILALGLSDGESIVPVTALLPAFAVAFDSAARNQSATMAQSKDDAESAAAGEAWHALLDELPQALVLVNGKDGRVREASLSCERTLGYSTSALAAIPLENWLMAPEAVVAVRAACETGRIHESSELTLYRRGGEGFPAQVRAIPLPAPTETKAHDVLILITDLTSHQEARQESRHLQRQAVLGWMAASFAHEIRNPLNNLSLQLEEMRALHTLAPDVDTLALESQNECRRLTEISRRMLDFARGQDFRPEPTDLTALVQRVLTRLQPTLERASVRSLFSAAEDLPPAMADALSIEQVILNLIENAAKAMPNGGHLGVSLEVGALESGAAAVEVRVADTGQGLPPQVREKLFQPYVTTRADGHGLGLALSRHIIDAHRGALRAETYPGSGTVFRVFLPVAEKT